MEDVSSPRKIATIRAARSEDRSAVWQVLEPVIRAGETYALPTDWPCGEALDYWFSLGHEVLVAEAGGEVVGTYFLRPNHGGAGSHVANCGYVTAKGYEGRGIARTMCLHSLELAKQRGFSAMQFNFVVSSNERAMLLWQSLGFEIVGRLPGAFRHPALGFVDALVMYRAL